MYQPLDGPSKQTTLSVTSLTVQEVKVGASALEGREVVTLQPDQRIYIYWGDESGTPSAGTVSSDGIVIYKNQTTTVEAASSQDLYILAVSATANVKIVERG